MRRLAQVLICSASLVLLASGGTACARFDAQGGLFSILFADQLFGGGPNALVLTESGTGTSVNEGSGTDSYTLALQSAPRADVTVNIAFDNTQLSLNGATASPISLTFTSANWNTVQTVTVSAVDDSIKEGPLTSDLTHASASTDTNAAGLTQAVSVSITDNDVPGVTVTETGGSTTVGETSGTDSYDVVLNSRPNNTVTIDITFDDTQVTVNGSGTSPATINFNPSNWSTPQTITVAAVDDSIAEGTHNATLTHTATSSDADYSGITINSVTVAVTDNDTPGVTITESGGNTAVTEAGATDAYDVVLNRAPTANVTVRIAFDPTQVTVNGSGTSPVDLTFTPANWNAAQIVTVAAVDDGLIEAAPHNSTITHMTLSTAGNYDALTVNSVTVGITDNDAPGVTITESGGNTAISEAGATDTYDVVLTAAPTANVTVRITFDPTQVTVNGSGTSPADLIFTPANWNTAQTVTVAAVDDGTDEHNHTSVITHTTLSGDGDFAGLTVNSVTATITDNDWKDANCTAKRRLTFDNSAQATTLTNFPVLVKLDSTRINYGSTAQNQIRFLDDAGNQLPHEIEEYNAAGTSYMWVRVPSISASSSTEYMWMYYNCTDTVTENAAGVWTSSYSAVWHLNDAVTDNSAVANAHPDSSGNAEDLDQTNNGPGTGKISGAQVFDGASDYLVHGTVSALNLTGSLTLSAWINPAVNMTGWNRIIEKTYLTSYYLGFTNGQTNRISFYLNNQQVLQTADNAVSNGVWSHVVLVHDNTIASPATNTWLYINGALAVTGSYNNGAFGNTTSAVSVGADSGGGSAFQGSIDEVRVISAVRSADWVAAQYFNMSDALNATGEFITYSAELN